MRLTIFNSPDQGVLVSSLELYNALLPALPFEGWADYHIQQFGFDEYIDYWLVDVDLLPKVPADADMRFSIGAAMQIARGDKTGAAGEVWQYLAEQRRERYRALGIIKADACREALSRPGLN